MAKRSGREVEIVSLGVRPTQVIKLFAEREEEVEEEEWVNFMRREGERVPHLLLLLCTPVQHRRRAGPRSQRQLPMWQEALWTRGRYLLEKSDGGEGAEGPDGLGDGFPSFQGEAEGEKPQDWLYESYYRMSQQHPLIVFLLLIVMGTCLALLAVFFASGLVSERSWPRQIFYTH